MRYHYLPMMTIDFIARTHVQKFEIFNDGGPFEHPATCDTEEWARRIVTALNAYEEPRP